MSVAIRLQLVGGEARFAYRLAGLTVACDVAPGRLAPFATTPPATLPGLPAPSPPAGEPLYRGSGWVGGRLVEVECRVTPDGYRLRVADAAPLDVAADGSWVRAAGGAEPVAAGVLDAALGPGLILALALRDVWCLHASAVATPQGALAFLGPGGSGKSTLAAALDGVRGWRRLADDVLPMRLSGSGVEALPQFLQPRLAAGQQWRSPSPEALPLVRVYLLDLAAGEPSVVGPPAVRPLGAGSAAVGLLAGTVAARLFDRDLTRRQLDACAETVRRLPVQRLAYRRRREELPAVAAELCADLAR